MLTCFELPPTVHHHAHHRVWQRGGYDLNIWSEKKRQEKLTYMHNNPVRRGLVSQPGEWPWSGWRFYYLEDSSILAMDPPFSALARKVAVARVRLLSAFQTSSR